MILNYCTWTYQPLYALLFGNCPPPTHLPAGRYVQQLGNAPHQHIFPREGMVNICQLIISNSNSSPCGIPWRKIHHEGIRIISFYYSRSVFVLLIGMCCSDPLSPPLWSEDWIEFKINWAVVCIKSILGHAAVSHLEEACRRLKYNTADHTWDQKILIPRFTELVCISKRTLYLPIFISKELI